jgi:hypothetical protein
LSYFFPSSSSPPSAINLFLLKNTNPAKIQHKFRTFFFKKKKTLHGEERRIVREGGPVQARNYEKTLVCRQTNGRRWRQRQEGAGVMFVAKLAMIPQSRFSHIWLQANYIYIYILYFLLTYFNLHA